MADHESISHLFSKYEELLASGADVAARKALALLICRALAAHATAEEELLYPAARDALEDDATLDGAQNDHDSMRMLMRQIEALDAADGRFDAMVTMLERVVAEHVQQEEGNLFPRLEYTSLDLDGLGQRIVARRSEVELQLKRDAPSRRTLETTRETGDG